MFSFGKIAMLAGIVLLAGCSRHDAPATVEVSGAWARATPPGAPVGAAYMELSNAAAQTDHLIALASPVAGAVEIHVTSMQDGVMNMRQVEKLELPPRKKIQMAPGGMHVMLMELKQPLTAGQSFPLTLTFEHAPPMTVTVAVRQP